MDILKYLVCVEILIIFLLFIIEIFKENIDYLYMEIITHTKLNKNLHILGDSLYMIGGSVTGTGIYEIVANNKILTTVLILGIILVIFGASIR
ncbi:hypothetical protein PJV93_10885 [Aliarcobacter butzleri]|uniref:Uncharacterized protein n=1 Tax=Aliarcobacter butzleri TaxID=28197 RepID=A0AAW7QE90_9BACT|nr:hypothetical protein [Aliarcobacter butzleri]MDN5108115.1 hypothetical protein [Aliarcobacter butzleri]MDN5124413.1 hypothetical protein [Aliarcobacter butzleri]